MFVLVGCTSGRPETTVRGVSRTDAQTIDRLFAQYARADVPGAAVAVIDDGRVAFARAYGLANLETRAPVTERTNFRLASLSKAFTAMAIMLLVQEGRLSFDERVSDVLPGFPAYGRNILIRHLLTHTSGLRAYQDFVGPSQGRPLTDRDVLELLGRTDTLLFPPGSAFRYGDSGYAVLALVVEAVSRSSFAQFLHDRVFVPAGMSSTLAYEPGVSEVPHRALGYAGGSAGFRLSDQSSASTVLGDGGIYSSVYDLIAWDRALDKHRLVAPPLQRLAWAPASLDDGTTTRYGFGWFVDRDTTGTYVSHRGETSGFTNVVVKYPTRRLTVVVLTNRRGGSPSDIATTITTLASFRRTSP
jgi:CubicO group peptidase (beta-lactamase class C family)